MTPAPLAPARTALVLGASGQIGHFLVPLLCAHGIEVEAVSRQAQASRPGLTWSRFDLYLHGDAARRPELVFSAGPLDGLLAWLARTRHRPERIVAFSSTSALTKQDSSDPAERELAARLARAEQALISHCQARHIGWVILRPTLIYGCGMDANLSRIAALARRFRLVPLPANATGLRQPVHAQDLAHGAWLAACSTAALGKRYELSGGGAIAYAEMVQRTVACIQPRGYVVRIPSSLFRLFARIARRFDLMPGFGPAMLERMRQDLVFPAHAAARDLGWVGRSFEPRAEDFPRLPDQKIDASQQK